MTAPRLRAGRLFRQLVATLHPWWQVLAVVIALVLLAAALDLVPPLLVRIIIDHHLLTGRTEGLLTLALLFFGAIAGVQVVMFGYSYLVSVVAQGVLHNLRVRLFRHLQRLPVSYFDRTPQGDIISRCTADLDTVDTLFSTGVVTLVADLSRLLAVVIAMVALSPFLTLVSLLVVPPLLVVTRFMQVRVRDAERDNRRAVGLLNSHLHEDLGGIEVVRAFGREQLLVARFRRALQQALAAFNRATLYIAFYPPVMVTLAALATALLLWAGTGNALADLGISIGTLIAFILLFQNFFRPIVALGEEWQTVQAALSGAERVFEVLSLPVEQVPEGYATSSSIPPAPALELRDVAFGYSPDRPVLNGISLAVQPGEYVALVGRTGAGKSSALHLLAGLYSPWSGTVSVGGIDPGSVPEDQRRRHIGFVPQTVQLFSGTVLDNLTLFDPDVPLDDVYRAARITNADQFIRSLPQGYHTTISGSGRGGGVQLSAGQQQLLALTRGLVWQPKVLVLDEATSAMDGESDASFRAALRSAMLDQACAVLNVAHRLAVARQADRVLVMEGGRILEEGSPEELVRRGGRFAALLELEAAGWDWRAAPPTRLPGERQQVVKEISRAPEG